MPNKVKLSAPSMMRRKDSTVGGKLEIGFRDVESEIVNTLRVKLKR